MDIAARKEGDRDAPSHINIVGLQYCISARVPILKTLLASTQLCVEGQKHNPGIVGKTQTISAIAKNEPVSQYSWK